MIKEVDIKKRIEIDMGYPLSLVSTFQRLDWIKNDLIPWKLFTWVMEFMIHWFLKVLVTA